MTPVKLYDKPRFHLSYQGNAEYDVGPGVRVRVRYSSHNDGWYNGDYYERGIAPAVGTVMYDSSALFHTFPHGNIVAMFPGYVAARWTEDFSRIEYFGGRAPETRPARVFRPGLDAMAHVRQCANIGLVI